MAAHSAAPPAPPRLDPRLARRLADKKAQLDRYHPLRSNVVRRLHDDLRVLLTYHSNAIEGNTLSLRETALVVEHGLTVGGHSLREYLEATNHAAAFEELVRLADAAMPMTTDTILHLHRLVMQQILPDAGQWRTVPVTIRGVALVPPAASRVSTLMAEWIAWVNDVGQRYDPIVRAAIAHHGFEAVHPFADGIGTLPLQAATHKLVGGAVCLDFVNTGGAIISDTPPTEYVPDYVALAAWSAHAGLVPVTDAQRLIGAAAQHPAHAEAVLQDAHQLRALLHRVFTAVAHDHAAAATDLAALSSFVATAMTTTQLTPTAAGYGWTWADDSHALDRMLWPIVRSAAELLVTGDLSRVRMCGCERCRWLFVDTSKNRSRRWCDMQDCGNVAKVRRFRTRRHDMHDHAE